MTTQYHPGEDNILSLRQGLALIRRLDPATFAGPPEDRSGVGSQFRHCIDFYDCFLGGVSTGRVDYNHRERDNRLATEPDSSRTVTLSSDNTEVSIDTDTGTAGSQNACCHIQMDPALGDVDLDLVTFFDEADGTAEGSFGRDVPDAQA